MKTVILAAGFGSRLWPLSTSQRPKQFQAFIDNESLLQRTYELLGQVSPREDLYVLTLAGLEHLVAEQLPGIGASNIIVVPERRNTLPHTAYALNVLSIPEDESVLFMSVDQYYADSKGCVQVLKETIKSLGAITRTTYLFCSKADTIDPSLGYIRIGDDNAVIGFIEKPSAEATQELAGADDVYINSMKYITSVAAFKSLLESVGDDNCKMAAEVIDASPDRLEQIFLDMPVVDISHGLFEKAAGIKALVIEDEFIDIGKFRTLYQINKKDQRGNVAIGAVVLDEQSHNNLVINQLEQPLAILNTQNAVVIQTAAGTVVSPMEDSEKIGEIYKSVIYAGAGDS